MSRCLGLSRNLHRCGRTGDWRFFCHDHRYQPLMWFSFIIFTAIAGIASIHSSWNTFFPSDTSTSLTATKDGFALKRHTPLRQLLELKEISDNRTYNKKVNIGKLIQQKATSMALLVQAIESRRSSGIFNNELENKMNHQVLQIDEQYSRFINRLAKFDRELERQKKANQFAARKIITRNIKDAFKVSP